MDGSIDRGATLARDVSLESPQLQPTPAADDWMQLVQQAWSFLPEDPTTAAYRLAELRDELSAMPRGTVEPQLVAYVSWLHGQSEQLERHWLKECADRERRFRLREGDLAALAAGV